MVSAITTDLYDVQTKARGPVGELPVTADMLLHRPSGDIFALSQNAGMGWNPKQLNRREFLILSTQGGIRNPDGSPVALGYHTGHWEVGLLMQAAAETPVGKRLPAVCRVLFRSVRRAFAGHDGDDGQPAVPQRRGNGFPPFDTQPAQP